MTGYFLQAAGSFTELDYYFLLTLYNEKTNYLVLSWLSGGWSIKGHRAPSSLKRWRKTLVQYAWKSISTVQYRRTSPTSCLLDNNQILAPLHITNRWRCTDPIHFLRKARRFMPVQGILERLGSSLCKSCAAFHGEFLLISVKLDVKSEWRTFASLLKPIQEKLMEAVQVQSEPANNQ